MRIAVIGGVHSTSTLLEKLYEYDFFDVKVWAYEPKNKLNVSGWQDLTSIAKKFKYKYQKFFYQIELLKKLN